jgi:hypothetical protein
MKLEQNCEAAGDGVRDPEDAPAVLRIGADYYDRLNPEKTIQRLVQRLGKLGQAAITPEGANA